MALTEKYRPKTLSEISGNDEIIKCLKSFKISDLPNMLFYGPPGTGKTTAIRALLSNHPKINILELNASDDRGISVVREQIKEFASTYSKLAKIVILDEADSMSKDAQGALRRIMEDYLNTRFCLICNYSKKIIDPILSRCTKFRFSPVNNPERILEICKKENIPIDEKGIEILNNRSNGDMRKVMNDIDGLKSIINGDDSIINADDSKSIKKESIEEFLGVPDSLKIKDIYISLINESFESALQKIKDSQFECAILISELSEIIIKSGLINKLKILRDLATIECHLAQGCSENIQLRALVGIFQVYK